MKTAVFYSAGIGDALLLTPLVKKLNADGHEVSAIVTGKDTAGIPLEQFGLFEEVLRLPCKSKMARSSISYRHHFDCVFLNVFACTRTHVLLACTMSKKSVCHKVPKGLPVAVKKAISIVSPKPNIHEGLQNLRLYSDKAEPPSIDDFYLDFELLNKPPLEEPYIVLQPCTGNNRLRYKNWPVERWLKFIGMLSTERPDLQIVLLGDNHELDEAAELEAATERAIINMAGKTRLEEAINYIKHARVFVGLDGGLMHLCAALDTPTFTLWGISDPKMYGYQDFSENHRIVTAGGKAVYSWLNPGNFNLERDDYLNALEAPEVYTQFMDWYQNYE